VFKFFHVKNKRNDRSRGGKTQKRLNAKFL
jgi:hypothetical protein